MRGEWERSAPGAEEPRSICRPRPAPPGCCCCSLPPRPGTVNSSLLAANICAGTAREARPALSGFTLIKNKSHRARVRGAGLWLAQGSGETSPLGLRSRCCHLHETQSITMSKACNKARWVQWVGSSLGTKRFVFLLQATTPSFSLT